MIHWRIGGGLDEYETVISGGTCEVHEGFESDEPGHVHDRRRRLPQLVTGNAAGPMLFMSGKLTISAT